MSNNAPTPETPQYVSMGWMAVQYDSSYNVWWRSKVVETKRSADLIVAAWSRDPNLKSFILESEEVFKKVTRERTPS